MVVSIVNDEPRIPTNIAYFIQMLKAQLNDTSAGSNQN